MQNLTENLTNKEKSEILEILRKEIEIWENLDCKKKRIKQLQKAINIISKYTKQDKTNLENKNSNDKITYGYYILEDEGDEHYDFMNDNNKITYIAYEDRILLFDVTGNDSYNMMTGTDCEHLECNESPSKATNEDIPGSISYDNWTNMSWKTSNNLFIEQKIWDTISENEKKLIEKQGWKIFVAREFKTIKYRDNVPNEEFYQSLKNKT